MEHTISVRTNQSAAMLLCFSGWEDGTLCGEVRTFSEEDPRPFRGLDQLLFAMEDAMDETGEKPPWFQPREPASTRRMSRPRSEVRRRWDGPPERTRGALATMAVRVRYRRNATIQGELQMCHPARTVYFRSALELMHLLWSELGPS